MKRITCRTMCGVATAAALVWLASPAYAIKGVLIQQDGRRLNGDIRWLSSSKEYAIDAGSMTMRVKASMVRDVRVAKPAGFDAAVSAVRAKRYAAALPALEQIMTTYRMLQWDIPATRYAAEAYLGMQNATKAIGLCEKLIAINPAAEYTGELSGIYWQALIEGGREHKLRKILDTAIQKGSRDLAALAQIRRGDIDMKKGDYKTALVDGYLRTIILFAKNKEHQPEAHFKAVRCFEQLNDSVRAERWRKKLLSEYPDSPYSRQVRMGE